MWASHVLEPNGPVSGKVLHGVGGRMQAVQFWRFDLEAWLHPLHSHLPLTDLPFPHLSLPQLTLTHAGVCIVQAMHLIGQERVCGVERDEEGMISVVGGHDVGTSVFAELAQGRRVRADVRGHSGNGGGWWIKRCPHMSRSRHRWLTHATLVRRTGRFSSSLSLLLSFPFPFPFFFSFPLLFFLFSCLLLRFPLGFLQCLLPLLCQF